MEIWMLNWIQQIHNPLLDTIMVGITFLGNYGAIWIAIGVILLVLQGFSNKKSTSYTQIYRYGEDVHSSGGGVQGKKFNPGYSVLLSLLLSHLIVSILIKPLVGRIRPLVAEGVKILIAAPKDFSFPSGHASASFAAATAIFLWNKKWGALAYLLALLISFSRLYLYVHYPSDVGVGILIGIFCGILGHFAYKKVQG